jgi:hypothetical protein
VLGEHVFGLALSPVSSRQGTRHSLSSEYSNHATASVMWAWITKSFSERRFVHCEEFNPTVIETMDFWL